MHIAFVNNTEKWGGVKTWSISMAKSMCDAGFQATLFGQDPVFVDKARSVGLRAFLYAPGPDCNPFAIRYYRRFFNEERVSAVIANVGKDLRTAGIAARLQGIPLIHRVGAPQDFRNTWKKRVEMRLLQPSFLCCSQYVLDKLLRNVPDVALYRGVAIHPGTQLAPRMCFDVTRPLRLVTTSRLSPDKKHIDLLQAVTRLRDEGCLFSLTIVGDGPERQNLEAYVAHNALSDRVTFTGFTTDVAAHLRTAHIFVLPTWKEPLGIALEEGMAHGLIPVARDAGGVPEIWPPALRRFLVPQASESRGFHAVLAALLQTPPSELASLRLEVYKHAAAHFSQEGQFRIFYQWVWGIVQNYGTR